MNYEKSLSHAHNLSKAGFASVWAEYLVWLQEAFPRVAASLTPATDSDVAHLEALHPQAPDDLKELFRLTGGERPYARETGIGTGIFFGAELLSVAEMVEGDAGRQGFFADSPGWVADPEAQWIHLTKGAIQEFDLHRDWLAFACEGNTSIAIDLAPGPKGVFGQIINFGRDEEVRYVLANSLTEWIALLLLLAKEGHASVGFGCEVVPLEDGKRNAEPSGKDALMFGFQSNICMVDQLATWKEEGGQAPTC